MSYHVDLRAVLPWTLGLGLLAVVTPALAQSEPRLGAPAPTVVPPEQKEPAPITGNANPVVASVDGRPIFLSDLGRALQTLPENLRGMPFETLYPVLVDRLVDHQALVISAKQTGLEDTPEVRKEIEAAVERILEGAYLSREATPKVTDQAVLALYNRRFAGRPATEEVRARHILVPTEAEARKLIEELRQGADFATLAKEYSKDPDAKTGGDLGFFRREQVWPAFADIAFSLQPGQIGSNPIHNEFGWHIVKVEERRLVAPPSLSDVQGQLRQELLAQAVQEAIDKARGRVVIRRYNIDGSEMETGPRLRADTRTEPAPQAPAPAPRAGTR